MAQLCCEAVNTRDHPEQGTTEPRAAQSWHSERTYRKRLRRQEAIERPRFRFITFSCYGRLPLLGLANDDVVKERFVRALGLARERHGFELFAWVVMPEHVHLLIQPQEGQVWATIASAIKNPVAKDGLGHLRARGSPLLARTLDGDGRERFWQHGGGFDRNVRDSAEFTKFVRYIHRNPVERELVLRPEDWRFSSVRWWMGERDGKAACDPPPGKVDWSGWEGYV